MQSKFFPGLSAMIRKIPLNFELECKIVRLILSIVVYRTWVSIYILLTCSLLLFAAVHDISYAKEQNSSFENNIYENEAPPETIENLKALLKNLIIPNIPGMGMLLVMSSFFSSINFYTAVQQRRHSFHVVTRYLAAWIFFNYLFALLILLLILPADLTLSEINKTLFVYCVVATAMPEIAANLKLQLGNSTSAIDLYKYKIKVSNLITERLGISEAEQRSKELMALAFFYYKRLDQFLDKLLIFSNQENLSAKEIEDIDEFRKKLEEHPVDGRPGRVMQLKREHFKMVPKLIEFFREDIQSFKASPVADLLDKLHPLLDIDEARRLVEAGVTNPRGFLWRYRFKRTRKRLLQNTCIDENRLCILFHSTRVTEKKRLLFRLRWLGTAVSVFFVVMLIIYWIQIRGHINYVVDERTKEHIISKELKSELQPKYPFESTDPYEKNINNGTP